MSPIFVRPVREQLEHDRLIRFLQAKYKRKFDAAVNVGDERLVPVKIGVGTFFPDLVLMSGKKLAGVVEVETGESVNNLEALAQWTHFSRARVPFHLYVPVPGYDATRRLCEANGARPAEIWTYRAHERRVRPRPDFPGPGGGDGEAAAHGRGDAATAAERSPRSQDRQTG